MAKQILLIDDDPVDNPVGITIVAIFDFNSHRPPVRGEYRVCGIILPSMGCIIVYPGGSGGSRTREMNANPFLLSGWLKHQLIGQRSRRQSDRHVLINFKISRIQQGYLLDL